MTRKKVKTNKITARLVGALFLLATATYFTGNVFLDSILTMPEYLSQVYPNRVQVTIGALLEFADTAAVVGIGILMFPILREFSEPIAVSYVATRIIECVFLVFGAIGPLLLIPLSQAYIAAGMPAAPHFQTLGTLFTTQHVLGFQIGMIALGLGSLLFCYLLYTSRLIPQWMSVLGFIGYAALLLGTSLELFGLNPYMIHYLPGGLFELILPIWLIVKGFNAEALSFSSSGAGPKRRSPSAPNV